MTPLTNFFRKIFGGMAATAKNGEAAVSPCAGASAKFTAEPSDD